MLPSTKTPRVLLDECLPRKLKREFAGCAVSTVPEMGWSGTKNGALLVSIAAGQIVEVEAVEEVS